MTTYKVNRSGVTFNGRVYKEGDTFDLADDEKGVSGPKQFLFDRVRNGEHPNIEKVDDVVGKRGRAAQHEEEEQKQEQEQEAPKQPAKSFVKTNKDEGDGPPEGRGWKKEGFQGVGPEGENKGKGRPKDE